MTDPFAGPAAIPTDFPKVQSLQGRLVLITPKSQKTVPNNLTPGTTKEQMTADVTVVDGRGPVPVFKNRQHTGQFLAGPDFPGMWIDSEVIVKQLADAMKTGGMVLATVNVQNPAAPAGKGNAWGLVYPTEDDKQTARNFLANRTISAASAPMTVQVQGQPVTVPPVQAAPVYVPQPAPAYVPQPAPAYVPPAAPPQLPAPGSAPVGANPFA